MDHRPSIAPWRTWRGTIIFALSAFCFTLLTVFVAANFVLVEVNLIFFKLTMRLAWGLLLAAVLGFGIGWLMARLRR